MKRIMMDLKQWGVFSLLWLCAGWLLSCQTQSPEMIQAIDHPTIQNDSFEEEPFDLPFDPGQVRFENYTVDNGLSMNTVHDILQDHQGYLWIATEDGLNRFDGYTFKIYRADPDNPQGMNSSNIQTLFEDRQGYLWLGGYEGGIARYDPYHDRFQRFSPDVGNQEISLLVITAIQQDQSGDLWFGTNDGLYQYSLTADIWTFHQAKPERPGGISSNAIHDLWVDSQDRMWIGSDGGLDILEYPDRFTHYGAEPNGLSDEIVNDIFQDSQGNIWVGTDHGLNRFDPDQVTWEHWVHQPDDPASLSADPVSSIVEDPHGNLWVGSREGLNLFDPESGSFTRYTANVDDPSSLSDDWIEALELDHTGSLWVGTAYGGVSYFHPLAVQFQHYIPVPAEPERVGENSVWNIYQDDAGTLWLGTNGGGLKQCTLGPFTCQEYRHDEQDPNSLSNDVVMDIHSDGRGGLWLATWGGGLEHFDPDSGAFTHQRAMDGDPTSLSSDVVWLIFEDSQSRLWIGTIGGLNLFDPQTGQFRQYHHNPEDPYSLSNDQIVGLFEDSNGQLWVGTQDGLNRFDEAGNRFTRFYHDPDDTNSLSHNTIFALYEDENGRLWIGTYGGGLNLFDPTPQTFKHYRATDGLVNDSIYGILADGAGNLWISTNNGISRFDPATNEFKSYDVADGLQAREFNFNAYFMNEDGEMFFGGVNGVTAFLPDDILDNPYPPAVVLQSISQGGVPLELDQSYEYVPELTLRWPNNYFDFEFAALNYYQSDQNQHAYLLENFDTSWNEIGTRRFGRYTNLPGGTYRLRLMGSNNDGLWNETSSELTIRVVPPLWQNGWFLGGMGLVLMVAVWLGYGYRLRTLRAQAADLEAQIEIRTNEINTRRRQIEALYKADEDLYRHLNVDQVLQALVDTAVELLKADKGSLLCWDENRAFLTIRASHNFHPETVAETRIPRGSGVVGVVAATGEGMAVEDARVDPRVTLSITETESIRSFIQVPIKVGERVFGVFSADYAQPRHFSQDEKRLLMSLAQRAATAIQNAQIYEQAQELAASQERNRLARELHDAVTQTLFSASLIAEALPALWERDPEKGRQRLEKLRQMSRGALAEMRALLLELRPAALLETSLENLLRQLGEAVMGRENISVILDLQGNCRLPSDVHIALYRIAQEALNNVVKHAGAKNVYIDLKTVCAQDDGLAEVELCIRDDGGGFEIQTIPPDRLGLGIMRERAEAIGAHLAIESVLGEGTKVMVKWTLGRRNDER